jgi:uncharacterized protein YbjT (DUF2867 family)
MSRILVIGASGTVGSELTRQLSQQGHVVVKGHQPAHHSAGRRAS